MYLAEAMLGNSRWQLNRHNAGHSLADSGGILKLGPHSCAYAGAIAVEYRRSNIEDLYSLDNGFIRDRELVRSVDLEFIQGGTFESYLTATHSPYDMMNLVEIAASNFLLHPGL